MTLATRLIEKAKDHGASFRLDQGEVKVMAPAPLPEPLMSELRQYKAELFAHLSGVDRCLACLCDNPLPKLNPRCPLCQSMTCAQCDQCTAYGRNWRLGWVDEATPGLSKVELLERLRSGQAWLTRGMDSVEPDDAFDRISLVWDQMEVTLRHVFEYRDCIHGEGQHCPDDAVILCVACAPEHESGKESGSDREVEN